MSGRNIISREISDSIRQCLGRKVKLTLKVFVKVETKGDKTDNRILAFASCRLFVLTAKIPTRVDQHFHYLDIQAIESRKPNQLCLTVCDRVYTYLTTHDENNSHEVDTMIFNLATALKNIFPSVPITHIIRKVDVQPPKRLTKIEELERVTIGGTRDMGPCGGFSTQYMCMCDYHALPYREEVAWDVDTIYLSHDARELNLRDFDYLEQKDLIPLISALEHNTYFNKLRLSHCRLSHEAVERILHVVTKSLSMEEIYFDNIGAKAEFANKLSLALLANNNIPIQKLDLSHNPLEDKGAVHISNPIGHHGKGLSHLNLSSCGMTNKGVNMISHSLSVNRSMSQTLTYLNLSNNSLRDDVTNLYSFLAQPIVLKSLDLSATECAIDAVFGALVRGCTGTLTHLNLSRNGFGTKKNREMMPSFKQFFTSSLALKELNFAHCRLPPDALKNVLLGLACNENINKVELDLSSNHLGSVGGQILESCIHGVRCLMSLDVSDNGLETQLGPVVLAISKNKSIRKINLSHNLNTIKAKHVFNVIESIVQMIQDEDCVLESLSIADSRLKNDLHSLLNALGSNHCLVNLDISGNYMGDSGARLLAKALQINSKLQYISYDRNNLTMQGYSDLAYALQSNHAMTFMPFPIHDAMLCMKTSPDKMETVMRRIQDTLHRNVTPMKYSNAQAFRLQQGFLLSSNQQQVDRLVLQTGESVRNVKRTGLELCPPGTVEIAEGLISDAESCKQLITHLHETVLRRDEAVSPIEMKLKQISVDLHSVINKYLEDNVESMVRSAQEKCPSVLCEEKVIEDIRVACLNKAQVEYQLIEDAIVDQAGSVILNRVSEVNLSIASTVSDHTIDEVVDSLTKTCQVLQCGDVPRKRASTGYEASGRDRGSSESSSRSDTVSQAEDCVSQKSDPSPMATPQLASKRKSLHGRKLRPQSVVAESLDSVSELPSSSGLLQHLGKARPRRVKTRQPTRPMGHADVLEEDQDISEGVDMFFRPGSSTPTTPLISPDSENSPRFVKYDSTSSMDSCSHTGIRTGSERGSVESLTHSDSIIRRESDSIRDSIRSCDLEEEEGGSELEKGGGVHEEVVEEKRKSFHGKLAADVPVVTKRSPDVSVRRHLTSGTVSLIEDKSRSDDDSKDLPKKTFGFGGRLTMGIGSNILAEIKSKQEKRISGILKDEESEEKSENIAPSSRLRPTGLAEGLKSPTNGLPRTAPLASQETVVEAGIITENPNQSITKGKPPPPLAPKPRPRSSLGDAIAIDESIELTEEDVVSATSSRSVKEMAASLVKNNEDGKKKATSLPRSAAHGVGVSPELLVHLDRRRRSALLNHQMEELEESRVDNESDQISPVANNEDNVLPNQYPGLSLLRQSSQKHVVSSDITVEDVVNV